MPREETRISDEEFLRVVRYLGVHHDGDYFSFTDYKEGCQELGVEPASTFHIYEKFGYEGWTEVLDQEGLVTPQFRKEKMQYVEDLDADDLKRVSNINDKEKFIDALFDLYS